MESKDKFNKVLNDELNNDENTILKTYSENDDFKRLQMLQINRLKNSIVFRHYDIELNDLIYEDAKECLFLFTLSAYEWFSLTPIFVHPESKYISELYKLILIEMIIRGFLKESYGWDNIYIRTTLCYWALSPEPQWTRTRIDNLIHKYCQKESNVTSMNAYDYSYNIIHPLSRHHNKFTEWESNTWREDGKYERCNRLPKYAKCPYCVNNEICMASLNSRENGPCGNSNAPYRCHIDSGIHLCSTHGQKVISYKDGDGQKKALKESIFLILNDGRVVGYLGWLRFKSKLDPLVNGINEIEDPDLKPCFGYLDKERSDLCYNLMFASLKDKNELYDWR